MFLEAEQLLNSLFSYIIGGGGAVCLSFFSGCFLFSADLPFTFLLFLTFLFRHPPWR